MRAVKVHIDQLRRADTSQNTGIIANTVQLGIAENVAAVLHGRLDTVVRACVQGNHVQSISDRFFPQCRCQILDSSLASCFIARTEEDQCFGIFLQEFRTNGFANSLVGACHEHGLDPRNGHGHDGTGSHCQEEKIEKDWNLPHDIHGVACFTSRTLEEGRMATPALCSVMCVAAVDGWKRK